MRGRVVIGSRSGAVVQGSPGRVAHRNRGIELRYALLREPGAVARCRPGPDEVDRKRRGSVWRTDRRAAGSNGKVIYPDRAAALAAATALQVVDGGARQVYRCPRSRDGDHFHLTSGIPRRVRASIRDWRDESRAQRPA